MHGDPSGCSGTLDTRMARWKLSSRVRKHLGRPPEIATDAPRARKILLTYTSTKTSTVT